MGEIAYLALGANIGDKEDNMRAAVRLLRESGCDVTAVSSLYRTKPVGVTDQPDFINAVLRIETPFSPRALLGLCQAIEIRLGRERTIRWGPRVIDIDILLFEDTVTNEQELILPHPRMLERAFVLVPLAEIAPNELVGEELTARDAADRVDSSGVELVEDGSWSN